MPAFFAGLDWASQSHAICVIDAQGVVCADFQVSHNASGLAQLRRKLQAYGGSDLPIAIERPSGLIVDALVETGFQVFPIHPNVVKATRPRYRSHGAKSDASDAYLLADLLRTDGRRFKPLIPQTDEIRALRALVRGRDDLVATRVQLANQLRSLLESFWPGAAAVFADVDSPIALAFIERYPTPESAARLGPKRMAAFCAQHAYCGRRSPEELLARHVASLADGQILMSFPRAGRLCAAQLLAELGSVRERFDSDEHLAAEAGVAPVTYQSGKSRSVTFRWACNHRLRAALTCLADNSRHANAWAAHVYAKAPARGCDHPHAVRFLARAWLRVIWRAWTDRKPYQPQSHRGAVPFMNKTAEA